MNDNTNGLGCCDECGKQVCSTDSAAQIPANITCGDCSNRTSDSGLVLDNILRERDLLLYFVDHVAIILDREISVSTGFFLRDKARKLLENLGYDYKN